MKAFYDIHTHIMNLSHPNFMAIIKRFNLGFYFTLNSLPILNKLVGIFAGSKIRQIINLLSIMDRNLGHFLLTVEEKDLKPLLNEKGKIEIAGETFDKFIMTPLMMDFNQKVILNPKMKMQYWYNIPPDKPIFEQTSDLFNAVKTYKQTTKYDLFEIYPFLGINTKNYEMESNDRQIGLIDLLDKYFSDFAKDNLNERYDNFKEKMGSFNGQIKNLNNYSFCGIKLYPPLGFNPCPGENKEKEKVDYLFHFCEEKQIPLTIHCGRGGFVTIPKKQARSFTDPAQWDKILNKYPDLKINFAHFGGEKLRPSTWAKAIIKLMKKYKNVYADISYLCYKDRDYKKFAKFFIKCRGESKLKERVLFGSDFLVNLLHTASYHDYINCFSETGFLNNQDKLKYCHENPQAFLWGT